MVVPYVLVIANGCSNPSEGCLGVSVSSTIVAEKPVVSISLSAIASPVAVISLSTSSITQVFLDAIMNQKQLLRYHEESNRGSRATNPDIPPISDNVVELLLLEQDRTHIVREIQRLEKRTISV